MLSKVLFKLYAFVAKLRSLQTKASPVEAHKPEGKDDFQEKCRKEMREYYESNPRNLKNTTFFAGNNFIAKYDSKGKLIWTSPSFENLKFVNPDEEK